MVKANPSDEIPNSTEILKKLLESLNHKFDFPTDLNQLVSYKENTVEIRQYLQKNCEFYAKTDPTLSKIYSGCVKECDKILKKVNTGIRKAKGNKHLDDLAKPD